MAKPRFLHDPEREPAVYAKLLPQAPPGPPRCFGALAEPGRHWLFLERVEGRELFQVGESGSCGRRRPAGSPASTWRWRRSSTATGGRGA